MAMQITERGKWIELVRTKYVPVKLIVLKKKPRAYEIGTGRSKREWSGKFPASAESLPPEIAEQLEPEEQDKVRQWLDRRAERQRLEERGRAKAEVATTMALAAEGYGDEKISREEGRAIWAAWQLLRAVLQRSGIQEKEIKGQEEPQPSPPKHAPRQGKEPAGADPDQS